MKTQKVTIPNPCHMKWADMEKTDDPQKRHCSSCAIDLIDFTDMTNEEIIAYLASHKNEKVCARMKTEKFDELKGYQKNLVDARLKIERKVGNQILSSFLLGVISIVLTLSGCSDSFLGEGEPAYNCDGFYEPDTTTADPSDSVWVEDCYSDYN